MALNSINRLDKISRTITAQTIVDQAFPVFIKNTPIDTGNARRRTEKHQDYIQANYPYAQVLEKGRGFRDGQIRGSNQAPKGISKPTIEYIRQWIRRTLGA